MPGDLCALWPGSLWSLILGCCQPPARREGQSCVFPGVFNCPLFLHKNHGSCSFENNVINTSSAKMKRKNSRLDYCNCLYAGVPFYLLERLQKIQNKAARLVLRKDRKHDSKELLRLLHWLPVQKRIDFKIACLVFKSLNNLSPSYIQDLIEIYKPTRTVRSSASISLKTPIPPNAFVGRAFSFNAPKILNNLSHGTRSCASLQSFKKCLKTEFFKSYFL